MLNLKNTAEHGMAGVLGDKAKRGLTKNSQTRKIKLPSKGVQEENTNSNTNDTNKDSRYNNYLYSFSAKCNE